MSLSFLYEPNSSIAFSNGVRSRLKRSNYLDVDIFYVAYIVYGLGMGLASTTLVSSYPSLVARIRLITQVVACALLLLRFLVQRFDSVKLLLVVALAIFMLAFGYLSDDYTLLWIILFVMCARGVDLKKIAWANLVVNLFVLSFAWFASSLGYINNLVFYSGGIARQTLGFLQPNNLGLRCTQICMSYFVIRFGRFKAIDYAVVVALVTFCFWTCYSRTSAIVMVGVLVCMMASRVMQSPSRMKAVATFSLLCFLGVFFCSLYFMISYDAENTIHQTLNSILSNRLYLMNFYFEAYPPTAIGQNLDAVLTDWGTYSSVGVTLDNAWAHVFEINGLIAAFILFAIEVLLCAKAFTLRYPNPFSYLLALFAVASFMEAYALNIFVNYSLIACACLVFGDSIQTFVGERVTGNKSKRVNLKADAEVSVL